MTSEPPVDDDVESVAAGVAAGAESMTTGVCAEAESVALDVDAGAKSMSFDTGAIIVSILGDRAGLDTSSVPHWLTRKRKLPNVRSIPQCISAIAGRSDSECGRKSKVPRVYGFRRSGRSRIVADAEDEVDEAAESIDPTSFLPTDGAN